MKILVAVILQWDLIEKELAQSLWELAESKDCVISITKIPSNKTYFSFLKSICKRKKVLLIPEVEESKDRDRILKHKKQQVY